MRIGHIVVTTLFALGCFVPSVFAQTSSSASSSEKDDQPYPWKQRSVWVQNPFGQQDAKRPQAAQPMTAPRPAETQTQNVQTKYPQTLYAQPAVSQPAVSRPVDIQQKPQEVAARPAVQTRQAVLPSSTGPLDRFVVNTSGTELVPEMAPTPTDARELTRKPSGTTVLTHDIPAARPAIQPNTRPEYEPTPSTTYSQTRYGDPTAHIHADARRERETLDPIRCGHRQPQSRDVSGCYDEWRGFCAPRNLDWECDCSVFPRREDTAGCRSCRSVRRCNLCERPTNGPCDCRQRRPLRRILRAIPACGRCGSQDEDCGCSTPIGATTNSHAPAIAEASMIPGTGLFSRKRLAEQTEVADQAINNDNGYYAKTSAENREFDTAPPAHVAENLFESLKQRR